MNSSSLALRRGASAGVLALAAGLFVLPAPAQALSVQQSRIIHVGDCSGAVLATRSGTWVLIAAHCGAVTRVRIGTLSWPVRQRVVLGSGPAHDLMLVRASANLERYTSGGFTLGVAPRSGTRVSVYGFPTGQNRLAGCSGLVARSEHGYPQVGPCYLPNGTSGGAWYNASGALVGTTGGLDQGGATNYVTNSVPFTTSTIAWVHRYAD